MTGDRKSFHEIKFKLDSGSDFTTINEADLFRLGYARAFLKDCPFYHTSAKTATASFRLQYIDGVSLKFGDNEIQNSRIFFAMNTDLRSLFGADILKYFNWEVNYDIGRLTLAPAKNSPILAPGEKVLHIYNLDKN